MKSMYATKITMNQLKTPRNLAMLALSGSIFGMIRNNGTSTIVMTGTRKTPQNLDMYPSISPAAFQCAGMGSGRRAYRTRPTIRAIAIKTNERMVEVFVDIFSPLTVGQIANLSHANWQFAFQHFT